MKVHFRTYCYGCRRGARWTRPGEQPRCSNGDGHRWRWEYWIECDGRRLIQRGSFANQERARTSAERSWFKLAAVSCITADGAQ